MRALLVVNKALTDKQRAVTEEAIGVDEGALERVFHVVKVGSAKEAEALLRSRKLFEASAVVVSGRKTATLLRLDLDFRRWYAVRFGVRAGYVVPVVVVAASSTRVSKDNAAKLFEAAKLSTGADLVKTSAGIGVEAGAVVYVGGAVTKYRPIGFAVDKMVHADVLAGATIPLE